MITVLVTCFDISGDYHGHNLIQYLSRHYPGRFRFLCIGGEKIRRLEGKNVILVREHITESSVGILEGVRYLFPALSFFRWFRDYLKQEKIDLLFCIDGQGRNLILGKIAKQAGIKTAYFFPPHVSIIGKWNIKKMHWFDLILNPFDADHRLYESAGHRSIYTGHPFQGFLQLNYKPDSLNKQYLQPLISIFPGSRYQEIKTLLPVFLPTVKELQKRYPHCSWVLSLSHEDFRSQIEDALRHYQVDIDIVHGRSEAIMARSYFILSCSGTATLKAAFLGVPHLIAYRISWTSYLIAHLLIYVNYIGMVNIVANQPVVNEFINHRLTVKNLVEETVRYLEDPVLRETKSLELKEKCHKYFSNSENLDPFAIVGREIHSLLNENEERKGLEITN